MFDVNIKFSSRLKLFSIGLALKKLLIVPMEFRQWHGTEYGKAPTDKLQRFPEWLNKVPLI